MCETVERVVGASCLYQSLKKLYTFKEIEQARNVFSVKVCDQFLLCYPGWPQLLVFPYNLFGLVFQDRASLCSPGYARTYSIEPGCL